MSSHILTNPLDKESCCLRKPVGSVFVSLSKKIPLNNERRK